VVDHATKERLSREKRPYGVTVLRHSLKPLLAVTLYSCQLLKKPQLAGGMQKWAAARKHKLQNDKNQS
jgi:hypothetical protein